MPRRSQASRCQGTRRPSSGAGTPKLTWNLNDPNGQSGSKRSSPKGCGIGCLWGLGCPQGSTVACKEPFSNIRVNSGSARGESLPCFRLVPSQRRIKSRLQPESTINNGREDPHASVALQHHFGFAHVRGVLWAPDGLSRIRIMFCLDGDSW